MCLIHFQINTFRHIVSFTEKEPQPRDEFEGYILKNYRPIQPLGTRRVTTIEHIFTTSKDFEEQFHKQGLFTGNSEFNCQFQRQGLKH